MSKVTAPGIRSRKGGPKIAVVTAYDYPGAVIADRAGIDIILVGDSVANVVHGMDTTLEIGLDEIVLHTPRQRWNHRLSGPSLAKAMPFLRSLRAHLEPFLFLRRFILLRLDNLCPYRLKPDDLFINMFLI
jgi:hypothetical protein